MKKIEGQLGTEGTLDALYQKKSEKLEKEIELERLKSHRENLEQESLLCYRSMTPYGKETGLKITDKDIERLRTELGIKTSKTPRS